MNWHEVVDERSYALHEVVAEVLRSDPSKLGQVVQWIEVKLADPHYASASKEAIAEWRDLIVTDGLEGVLRILGSMSEDAVRMRQSSPFAILMPQGKRQEIFRRYEARRSGARPSSF